jgi:hypothetical protein
MSQCFRPSCLASCCRCLNSTEHWIGRYSHPRQSGFNNRNNAPQQDPKLDLKRTTKRLKQTDNGLGEKPDDRTSTVLVFYPRPEQHIPSGADWQDMRFWLPRSTT